MSPSRTQTAVPTAPGAPTATQGMSLTEMLPHILSAAPTSTNDIHNAHDQAPENRQVVLQTAMTEILTMLVEFEEAEDDVFLLLGNEDSPTGEGGQNHGLASQ